MTTTALTVLSTRAVRGRITRHSHPPLGKDMRAMECVQCDWEERQATDAARRKREQKRRMLRMLERAGEGSWNGPDHDQPVSRECHFCEKPVRGIWYYERRRPWIYRGERIHTLIAWAHTRCARAEGPTAPPQ